MLAWCFLFLGYNSTTNVHSCPGEHCKRDDELCISLPAGSRGQVGAFPHYYSWSNQNIVHTNMCLCLLSQWLCGSKRHVSDLHLCFSVCLHLVEEAPCDNMGGWERVISGIYVVTFRSHKPLCLCWCFSFYINLRLVCRLAAGVGLLHETGCSKYTDEVLRVVGLWARGIFCR